MSSDRPPLSLVIALTILPLRLIKGVLVAQQYHHRSTAGEDGPT